MNFVEFFNKLFFSYNNNNNKNVFINKQCSTCNTPPCRWNTRANNYENKFDNLEANVAKLQCYIKEET